MTVRSIHFIRVRTPVYGQVQRQLFDLIQEHLPTGTFAEGPGYIDGAVNVALFVRHDSDVVMSHGVADKDYFWHHDELGMFARGKYVLVPGRWHRDRLTEQQPEVPPGHVREVGWPRLDFLFRQRDARVGRTESQTSGADELRVLWAPTHDDQSQQSDSSYPGFEPFLDRLREHAGVTVAVHPRNREVKNPTGVQLLETDVVIADMGTLLYEAWALGKPVIFPRWLVGERVQEAMPHSAEARIHRERIGYHVDSFDELLDVVELLRERPPLTADVLAFLDDYLAPEFRGCSGARVAEVLLDLAADPTFAPAPRARRYPAPSRFRRLAHRVVDAVHAAR